MDNKSMYALSYGVFMVGTRSGDKKNGCITNTCIQVASSPTRVALSLLNTNYTCDIIKESSVFTVSMLDTTVRFETIKHFGMQSGRDVDKFESINLPEDENKVPYLNFSTCAMLSCKVVESHELGSHTLFIAEVLDGRVLSNNEPLTYAMYQSDVKPKPVQKLEDKKVVGWKCTICGHIYEGSELPKDYLCPICGHSREDFEPIYE